MAIGQFVNDVKDKEWAKNTIFIFVADHGFRGDSKFSINWENFRIPLLVWSPGNIFKPEVNNVTGSQVDILPTIMGVLGGEYKNSSWGKNLFEANPDGSYAFIVQNNFYGVVNGDYFLIDGDGVKPKLVDLKSAEYVDNKHAVDVLHKVVRTYLELETYQLKNGTFAD